MPKRNISEFVKMEIAGATEIQIQILYLLTVEERNAHPTPHRPPNLWNLFIERLISDDFWVADLHLHSLMLSNAIYVFLDAIRQTAVSNFLRVCCGDVEAESRVKRRLNFSGCFHGARCWSPWPPWAWIKSKAFSKCALYAIDDPQWQR